MPLALVAKNGHPLFALGDRLRFQEVAQFPLLALPQGAFPAFEQVVHDCGLGRQASPSGRSAGPLWQGRPDIDDLMIGFATPLTMPLYGESYRRLPLQLPIEVGDALVVHRDVIHYPQLRRLVSALLSRLRTLAQGMEEVSLFEMPELAGPNHRFSADECIRALAF
jgi:hypothetical protein